MADYMVQWDRAMENLDGNPIKMHDKDDSTATIGRAMATLLVTEKQDGLDPFESYELAVEMHKSRPMKMTQAMIEKLRQVIKSTKAFGPLVTGQIAKVLSDAKECTKG